MHRRYCVCGDQRRKGSARTCEMVEQIDEKCYGVRLDALFIEGQNEAAAGGFQKEIAVLDALGDALARYDRADIVAGDERGELVGIDVRVDGHQTAAGSNPRGSLNTIFSSVMTATSSTIARRPEEHTSELQSLMRIPYVVILFTKKTPHEHN